MGKSTEQTEMTITIDNITVAQKEAIEDMLATWVELGKVGSSRWTAFYADGDGNFRPRISIDGSLPEKTKRIKEEDKWKRLKIENKRDLKNGLTMTQWRDLNDCYMIDFDGVAWAITMEEINNTK